MLETEKLLKSILLQVKVADTLEDAVSSVENLCEKEWIAEAEKRAQEMRDRRKK